MNLNTTTVDSALIITPDFQRLDAAAAPEFREKMTTVVSSESLVVLVLKNINFMDSSGLGSMIAVLKRIPAGGELRLVDPNPMVKNLLKTTRLDRVFRIYDSIDQAVKAA